VAFALRLGGIALRSGWDRYEYRGTARTTWEQIKDAVRDGWDHIVGNK
jgi:hypothetical protein